MSQRMNIGAVVATLALVGVIGPRGTWGQTRGREAQNREQQKVTHEDRKEWKIRDDGEAIAQARQILGLSEKSSARVSATLVTLAEDNTPFLNEKLVGRPIWQVVITDWRLELASAPQEARDSFGRTFDVFLDPPNGALLKLASRWPDGVPVIAPEPPAAFAAEQMKRAGLERYHGFVSPAPPVDFVRALDVVYKDGVGDPLVAKQIVAHCIMRSAMEQKPRAVWAITLRGIAPLKAAYPGVPIDARNHIRNIVDAKTGKWLSAGTSPQPQTGDESGAQDEKPTNSPQP